MSLKKILILGASELQIPAILEARKMGIFTIVADYDSNAIGKKFADKFYEISTLDYASLLDVAKKEKIDGIMTICSDRPMTVVARIGEKLNLSTISLQAAINATDKSTMRKVLRDEGIPIPKFSICRNKEELVKAIDEIGLPLIVKPSDNSGSRGVFLIKKIKDIDKAFNYSMNSSSSKIIVAEEYMVGPEVSVEIFVENSNIHVIQVTDKETTGSPHFVELGHSQPSCLPNQEEIEQLAIKAVKALEIFSGPAHVEIIITKEGPKIVEVGARLGGDHITTDLVPLSTTVNMVRMTIESSLNMKLEEIKKKESFSTIKYIIDNVEKYKKAFKVLKVDSLVEFKCYSNSDCVDVKSSNDRLGYYIMKNDDKSKLIRDMEYVQEYIEEEPK